MNRLLAPTLILLLSLLSACSMPAPSDAPEPGDSPPDPTETDPLIIPVITTCTENDLNNYSFCQNGLWCTPGNWEFVPNNTPLMEWEGPGCQPSAYKVEIIQWQKGIVFEGFAAWDQNLPAFETSLQVNSALAPGGHYSWRVIPYINGVPYPNYQRSTFFTGPLCEMADLVAPDLVEPADDGTISNNFPGLILSYAPACLPAVFLRELDTSPSFNGPNLITASETPSLGQAPIAVLEDCTKYYWRAKALILGYSSPWSVTFSFETDFNDSCPGQPVQLLPTSTASLTPPQATDTPLPTATPRGEDPTATPRISPTPTRP